MKKLSLFLIALTMILFSCKPEVEKPTVVTKSVGDVTKTSAKVVGQVAADGGAEVTERGVCWSTDGTPTILDFRTVDGTGVGSYTSSLRDLAPQTTYYVRAYATNEAGIGYGDEKTFVTEEPEGPENPEQPEDGHAWVDLGLPSGKKWATCNVGATSPEEYGDYFAWGETRTKETYDEDNCPTYGLSNSQLQSQGYIDSEGNLTSQYDAARANWGGYWRMPTDDEWRELKNNCTWIWTSQNGVNGYKVTGPSGASIFLPAAGDRYGSSLDGAESYGEYWSSTPYDDDYDNFACCLGFDSDLHIVFYNDRGNGRSVRPVSGSNNAEPEEPEEPEQPEEGVPVVTTAEVTEIKLFSAVCGGEVVSNGESVVVARGVCWSIEQNPTIEDSHTTDGVSTGIYTSSLTELNHGTTYYVRAYATNEVGTVYGEERTFKTLALYSPATGTSNGYGYVDLGLSVKWATCNVGATSPEEYGDYFAWGETSTKETYNISNCPTYELIESELQSQGYIDSEGNLTAQYDAATANWGGNWRMPTYDELNELITKCTWEWININDFKGYSVTGPNGNNIFLPAAGYRNGSSLYDAGSYGSYWSSTPYVNSSGAYSLHFDSGYRNVGYESRFRGRSVRSILE